MLLELPTTPVVSVQTTDNRGFTPEEVAKRCTEKIVDVSQDAHPAIREQAEAFKLILKKL